jgi:hypothetical protein
MTTPLMEWTCYHCGQRCGGRLPSGYGAIIVQDGSLHASCHPDDPAVWPDCYRRVTEFGELPGALVDADPKPTGINDIRLITGNFR